MRGARPEGAAMRATHDRLLKLCAVPPGRRVRLAAYDPADALTPEFKSLRGATLKTQAATLLDDSRQTLAKAQDLLWASDVRSVLVVLQGMDAAGKDGIVKHVMSGMNPAGCEVHAFKPPSDEELSHNFLWRSWRRLPARGRIGIFNRSYYEEVLIVRVHPRLLRKRRLPGGAAGARLWEQRFEDINHFERHLVRNGTAVIKIFLNLSKGEQRRRLLERLADRNKRWKFSIADLRERGYWREYRRAYEAMLGATSTDWAPWYVVPADHKFVARSVVASIVASRIAAFDLRYPEPPKATARELARARRRLLGRRGSASR
jgi:PPK2 family polyphosphate:nucleotide phosphotransferase